MSPPGTWRPPGRVWPMLAVLAATLLALLVFGLRGGYRPPAPEPSPSAAGAP